MPGRSAAPRSHCHRDSPQRSAARGSGSSRRARAVPVPDHADLRGRRPGVRQSPAVARWPTAARSRQPKSTDRRRKRCVRVCPSPMANRVESPYFLPWRGRTPLASIDPASATKSYTKPKVYLPPASPLMQPGELFGLDDPQKTAVITQRGIGEALGHHKAGSGKAFLRSVMGPTVAPYLGAELVEKLENPILFQGLKGGADAASHGYDVTILIDVCKAIVLAEAEGKLRP